MRPPKSIRWLQILLVLFPSPLLNTRLARARTGTFSVDPSTGANACPKPTEAQGMHDQGTNAEAARMAAELLAHSTWRSLSGSKIW